MLIGYAHAYGPTCIYSRVIVVKTTEHVQATISCARLSRQQLGSFLPTPNNPPVNGTRHWSAVFSVMGGVSVDRDLKNNRSGAD